ncbi:MAG TPA: antibiotic biosynthesis monooxygenase family protein [Magnetospirillaceae bacterium]|nr:antibiotic biosynthesis monooxygenase family protein [Magnetospirillaceae bacterium]
MYISRIIFTIKDGQQGVFEDTANRIVQIASALPGCRYFGLSKLTNEPTKYMLYEEWDSKQHADVFKASKERNDAVAHVAPTMGGTTVMAEYLAEPQQ